MKRSLLSMALLAALPLAQASELSYSYLEAGYFNVNPKGFSSEDGWGVRGSAAISDNFHLFGGAERIDIGPFNIDLWRVGLGYHHALSDRTDLLFRVAYEDFDFDDGVSLELGLRSALAARLETYIGIGFSDASDDFSGEAYVALQGQYRFNSNWGLSAEAKVYEDGHTLFIGPRVTF